MFVRNGEDDMLPVDCIFDKDWRIPVPLMKDGKPKKREIKQKALMKMKQFYIWHEYCAPVKEPAKNKKKKKK